MKPGKWEKQKSLSRKLFRLHEQKSLRVYKDNSLSFEHFFFISNPGYFFRLWNAPNEHKDMRDPADRFYVIDSSMPQTWKGEHPEFCGLLRKIPVVERLWQWLDWADLNPLSWTIWERYLYIAYKSKKDPKVRNNSNYILKVMRCRYSIS